jgi:soluble lytic murein transglycosylase-like protein
MRWPAVLFTRWMLAVLCLVGAGAAQADVWAWVDERGVAHFASEQVDARYELFFKGDPAATDPLAAEANEDEPQAAMARKADRLRAFFEVSPDYKAVRPTLKRMAQQYQLDEYLLQALIATESGFDADAVSPKGAIGLMQLMPDTARRFGVKGSRSEPVTELLRRPAINLRAGSRYLRHLLDRYQGDLTLALAAYNAGEGAVQRAGRQVPPYRETENYVQTVQQLYALLLPPESVQAAARQRRGEPALASTTTPATPATTLRPSGLTPGQIPGRGNLPPVAFRIERD